MESKPKVCITGSSGYIGSWVTKIFLEDGKYSIRGTVRDSKNKEKVDNLKSALGDASAHLELVSADLLDYESLERAFEGCDYVVHVASPLLVKEPKDPEEVLGPAVKGTENAIKACWANNVKRIVITASALNVINWSNEGDTDEDTWAPVNEETKLYDKSKVLAEKKVWEMRDNQPEGKNLEFVTILPALVTGKALFKADFASAYLGTQLMTGKLPKAPDVAFCTVDVEDVAKGHLLGITAKEGERYCLTEGTYKIGELGRFFAEEFKKYGYKCTEKELSYCMAKMLSCCISDLKFFLSVWGKRVHVKNDKSIKMLGFSQYKTIKQSIAEMGWSFIELGMVPDKTKGKR